jgi:hypothetical protein
VWRVVVLIHDYWHNILWNSWTFHSIGHISNCSAHSIYNSQNMVISNFNWNELNVVICIELRRYLILEWSLLICSNESDFGLWNQVSQSFEIWLGTSTRFHNSCCTSSFINFDLHQNCPTLPIVDVNGQKIDEATLRFPGEEEINVEHISSSD